MKKDIEWLREEIGTEMIQLEPNRKERWSDVKYQTLRSVSQKIDQLNGPEVTLDSAFDKISESYPMTREEIWRHLEQIVTHRGKVTYGEPEVLSQEWIDEYEYIGMDPDNPFVYVKDLQNLIVPKKEITEEQVINWLNNNEFYDHITAETVLERAVDKGELSYYGTKYSVIEASTIPKYVADWIEGEQGTISNWKQPSRFISDSKYKKDQRRYKWSQVEGNMDKFMSALINGYEVEKEPLFYAKIKGWRYLADYFGCKYWGKDKELNYLNVVKRSDPNFIIKFTKSEWNGLGINDSNADFVKVEELEE